MSYLAINAQQQGNAMNDAPEFKLPLVNRTREDWEIAIKRNRAIAQKSSLIGAVQILKGRYFWPLDPHHEGNDFDIDTIAHNLSLINRWGGQTSDANGNPLGFSVAQHSVYVSIIAEQNAASIVPKWNWDENNDPSMYGLIHDACEGYGFADVVRPVKQTMRDYKSGEQRLLDRIIEVLDVPYNMAIGECVRRIDSSMVFWERDLFLGQPVIPYTNEIDHPRSSLKEIIPDFRVWKPAEAKQQFIARYIKIKQAAKKYD